MISNLFIMSFRFMRLMLFFDLPTEKSFQRKKYSAFLKNIKKLGFYMLQKSVYLKLCMDSRMSESIIEQVKNYSPEEGSIAILTITEKQFSEIRFILGETKTEILNDNERLVEL